MDVRRSSDAEDERELRFLLDALGIEEESGTPPLDDMGRVRAEQVLWQITREPVRPQVDTADRTATPASPARRRARWWRTTWRTALVATAVVALVAVGVVVVDPSREDGASSASAATPPLLGFSNVPANRLPEGVAARPLLNGLARAAARQPAPQDAPVQHVQSDGWWASSDEAGGGGEVETVLFPVRVDSYFHPDGDLRLVERRGQPLDEDGRLHPGPVSWDAAGRVSDTTFRADPERGPELLATLPRDPRSLAERLAPAADCPGREGECLLETIAELHATYVVPPATASRLWRALATHGDVQTLGATRDRSGRDAVVLSAAPTGTTRLLVLVEPATGRYLGSERVLVEPDPAFGFTPPAVVEFTSLVGAARIAPDEVPDASGTQRH